MKKRLVFLLFILLVLIVLVWYFVCRVSIEKRPPILLKNTSGIETTEFQLHDSILFDAVNLSPRTGYKIQIVREDGKIITESRLSTDQYGQIPETVIWYDIGILQCLDVPIHTTKTTHLSEYEIRNYEYAGKNYSLKIIEDENIVREISFRVIRETKRPKLYASDSRGCPKSGFLIGEEDVWVVGKNFPKGSIIRLWAVSDNVEWKDADQLKDVTKQYNNELSPLFELKLDDTGFKKLLWLKGLTSIGSYDIVAEVVTYPFGSYYSSSTAKVKNVVSNLSYSGFVIQRRQGVGEPLEQNAAGVRMSSKLAYRDAFLTTEDVYAGVDPYVHPSYIGMAADVYIVADKTDAQWTTDMSLVDVTGFVETVTIQPGTCANAYSTLAWAAPLIQGEYDLVLDFNQDGVYTHGVDLIDSLDPIGFTVAEVRVESISFNYSGSGAITIYDNINGSNINPPEYSCGACDDIKPAAWVMGGSYAVKVNFKAVPAVNFVQIWAENGLGGLDSSSSPVTVSFSGGNGQSTFSPNSVPNSIDKRLFDWNWKYKNVNGASTGTQNMGITGKHIVYTVHSSPKAPMTTPWLEVLEYGTDWASGETTEAGVVDKIVNGIYNSGMVYDGGGHHTTGMGNFNLTAVFNELRTSGLTVYMDCRDCANLFHVLTNALGFAHQYLRIPGYFTYKPMLPMGVTWTGSTSCVSGGWNYHQVGWCGSHVADASTELNCTSSVTSLILAICDITAINYINYLTDTAGISPGSTSVCSPY
jgi:hypothetical protein